MVTLDNRYVHDGIWALIRGTGQYLLDGEDGDLWRMFGPDLPVPRWIPSHHTLHDAVALGHMALDWVGNDKADQVAKMRSRNDLNPWRIV